MMKYNYDIVIVGVGIVGSSILYQLAKNGYKVLGIEQFEIPHDRGSSHGDKRIIRLAPFEGDIYYHMSKAVLPLWKEVEQSAKKQLYFPVGGLDIGHKDEDHFLTAARICKTFKLPYEILTSKQIRERHPAFSISSPDIRAVYQPGGGYILANESWKTFVELAKIYSAEIQTNVTVKDIQYNHNEAIVITENSEIISKKVIVTAGGWTSQLLPFLKSKLSIERQSNGWFDVVNPSHFEPQLMPIFTMKVDNYVGYGFPIVDNLGFKVGCHHCSLDTIDDPYKIIEPCPMDEKIFTDFVKPFFPSATTLRNIKTCKYTNTKDHDFLIGNHPQSERILIFSCCSGHGFKYSPLMGVLAKNLVEKSKPIIDLQQFRLNR